MRNLALALGALGAIGIIAIGACSDDVSESPTPPTPTGTAGAGGATTTTTTPAGGAGGAASCAGVSGVCNQACCKIENECDFGFSVTCSMLNTIVPILDCENNQPAADCNGQCVLDATCPELSTLIGTNWDPTLQACLAACNSGDCVACVAGGAGCQPEFSACMQDTVCQAFMACMTGQQGAGGGGTGGAGTGGAGQACDDPDCLAACEAQNSNAVVTALVSCTCTECSAECGQCGSGGSGTGGAGGAGGG